MQTRERECFIRFFLYFFFLAEMPLECLLCIVWVTIFSSCDKPTTFRHHHTDAIPLLYSKTVRGFFIAKHTKNNKTVRNFEETRYKIWPKNKACFTSIFLLMVCRVCKNNCFQLSVNRNSNCVPCEILFTHTPPPPPPLGTTLLIFFFRAWTLDNLIYIYPHTISSSHSTSNHHENDILRLFCRNYCFMNFRECWGVVHIFSISHRKGPIWNKKFDNSQVISPRTQ